MKQTRLTEEQLNIRCFYLRLLKRIWVLPLAAFAGALGAYLLYGAVTRVTRPALYEAKAQFYLHFVEGASYDKVYDHYNAYTWNDLIHADPVTALLYRAAEDRDSLSSYPEGGGFINTVGRENMGETCMRMYEEGTLALSVLQPSDLRIIWLTATCAEEDCAAWFIRMASQAVVQYGEENEVFRSIERIDLKEPVPVTYPERAKTATLTGAVLALLVSVFALLILHLLDDAVYVPEDAEKRYGLPVVAVTAKDAAEFERDGTGDGGFDTRTDKASPTPEENLLDAERVRYLQKLKAEGKRFAVLTAGPVPAPDQIKETYGRKEETRADADVLLLSVPCGKKCGTLTEHVLSQARARGEQVDGIVFTNADMHFLKRYYRI